MMYLVVALYEDGGQRYATSVEAESPYEAECLVQGMCYIENNASTEEEMAPLEVAESCYLLTIAGVVKMDGSYELAA